MAVITRYVNTGSTAGGDGTTNATAGANRAYASLSECEANEQADFVTATDNLVVYCTGTTADTTLCEWDGSVTDATYDIWVGPNTGQEHGGVWNTGVYRLYTSFVTSRILDLNVTYSGLQLGHTNTGNNRELLSIYSIEGGIATVEKCILKGPNTAATGNTSIRLTTLTASATANIRNNIIYDCGTGTASCALSILDGDWILNFDNNTMQNGDVGVYMNTAGYTNKVFRNNVAQDFTDGYYSSSTSWATGTDYNLSDVASDAPGSNSINSTTLTFADKANDDFHLASGDTHNGTSLSGTFTDDIDGDTRTNWHMGADEYIAAGGLSIPIAAHHYNHNIGSNV